MKKLIAWMLLAAALLTLSACASPAVTQTDADAEPAPTAEAAAETVTVRYLNLRPEAEESWKKLAALYEGETGVAVEIVTAEPSALPDALSGSDAPALFEIKDAYSVPGWEDFALELTDTPALLELSDAAFALRDGQGTVRALPCGMEAFGLLTNTRLLAEAGFAPSDIYDFASLQAAAQYIHGFAQALGFDAFATVGLDGVSAWRYTRLLANMPLYYELRDLGASALPARLSGSYLDNYRSAWELYVSNGAKLRFDLFMVADEGTKQEFGTGGAAFCLGGSWELEELTERYGMDGAELTLLPLYCGVAGEESAAPCIGSESYWAVNAQVSESERQAALDFLYYCVSNEECVQILSGQLGALPYKNAPRSGNVLTAAALDAVAAGQTPVPWAIDRVPNQSAWSAGLADGLIRYAGERSELTWAKVVDAYLDGWAINIAAAMR